MACTGFCTLDALSQSAISQTRAVGEAFVDQSFTSFNSIGGAFFFCADCAENVEVQYKKSTDSVWIIMSATGALKTSDPNSQSVSSADCEITDVEASWTITVDASAAGFVWDVRLIKSSDAACASGVIQVTVPAAGGPPLRTLTGVGV